MTSVSKDDRKQLEALCGTDEKDGLLKPVSWSTKDTPETILDAKRNNAVYKDLCGHRKNAK
ncbi:hypothetical protein Q669_29520 [Labrenzia sp. C1B10]|uniref:hypothetical protein n=1 Tax=Labrenzia sp. C1B10 TaxID=1397530 RepID=UPI0003B899FB|nr:hypothetical protein [Labrenzia sp. C1B10]ERP95710.1 hypothetical protein Q669_29520 [Labrenzia sp. C1B10]ERS05776.1 hypothetical protein Q675_29085 [Labrenzia sp. C1B70]